MPQLHRFYRPNVVVGLFFGLLLLLGALLVGDYGVSWDEPTDYQNGLVSLRYVTDLIHGREPTSLADYPDSDHGVLFELPLAALARFIFNTPERVASRDYYLLRHSLTFLTCWGGLWALYGLARLRLRNAYLALLPVGLFVLSPRLFAESFYNAKDLLFLAVFTLGMYTLARLMERPTPGRALLHGLATAAAIDVRLLGVLLVPFTLTMLVFEALWSTQPQGTRRGLMAVAGCYLLATAAATVAAWPYLWAAPFTRFGAAFQNMSHFRWDNPVLYWGRLEPSINLPWHYGPVWLLITTPVAYSLGALLGLGLLAGQLLRRPLARLRTPEGRLDLLFGGWLVLPFLLVIGLHSVIYDGWRHLYFTYPALLLLAVGAGRQLWQGGRRNRYLRPVLVVLGLLAGLEMVVTASRMVRMHPHQQVYFSFLTPRQIEYGFERDYWGLSYRQGLEYLVRSHPTGPINVAAAQEGPFANNLAWLSPADQQRIHLGPAGPGVFYLLSYRSWPGPPPPLGWEIYAVKANGLTIFSVLQR